MFEKLFACVLDAAAGTISVGDFLLCVGVSLGAGLILALAFMYRARYTKSFVVTLAMLPAVVCVVIMMVNGNVGAGVAVAGAFSLVRFRSVPGTAREIGMLFVAMGTGLITGMGYLGFGVLFAAIMCLAGLVYSLLNFGGSADRLERTLRITIPEDQNYTEVFDDVLRKYAGSYELVQVKTTNMGSLFRLTYHITLRPETSEKDMIDTLRCRNGNLEISLARQETPVAEL